LDVEYERYRGFIADGKHGAMAYLAEHAEARQRLDGESMLPGARSVICLARRYDRPDEDPPLAQRMARYARGRDYHNVLRRKLRRLAAFVRELGTAEAPVAARPLTDDAPILERAWAARAGLGFVGKNGLLIVPGQGSWLLLGEVITTLPLPPDEPIGERCGACTRCLETCPTDAFEQPFVLDPRKCLSYWTIEHRGDVPEPFASAQGGRLFGCDDCQTVCPWNAPRVGGAVRGAPRVAPFVPLPRWSELSLEHLRDADDVTLQGWLSGSPLARALPQGIRRNAAQALRNEQVSSPGEPPCATNIAMHPLAKGVLARELRSVARALRVVDDRDEGHLDLLRDLFPHTGKAQVIGVTGNPGAGKSTLTDRLIAGFRKQGKRVAVIAVDPTSPYTGGAILGDRIRMQRHATDPEVFIRSVATRGHMGGLSRSARDMVRVLDAWGADVVLVETVGVGQDELEVTRTAHTTLVVMAPGLGDEVQAIKAGIMEVADVFAVNKADRDGADGTVRDIELMIALGSEAMLAASKHKGHVVHGVGAAEARAHGAAGDAGVATDGADSPWTPPIVRAVAVRGEGIDEIVDALERHRAWITSTETGRARRRERLAEEMRESLREALIESAARAMATEIQAAVLAVEARETDPYSAIERLRQRFQGHV
jgi:LAO/AO transport system ATPase/epoxyqueuosine reductase